MLLEISDVYKVVMLALNVTHSPACQRTTSSFACQGGTLVKKKWPALASFERKCVPV